MLNIKELLVGQTNRMRNVIRYSTCPRAHDENLAEHHYYTTLFSAVIAIDLARLEKVELHNVMLKALVHDVEESVSGDFMRSFKHSSPELKAAIEHGAVSFVDAMFVKLGAGVSDRLFLAWKKSKDTTLEGRIVKLADFLSVISYVYQELAVGNKLIIQGVAELREYWESIYKDESFAPLAKYFPEIDHMLVEIAHMKGDVYGGMHATHNQVN